MEVPGGLCRVCDGRPVRGAVRRPDVRAGPWSGTPGTLRPGGSVPEMAQGQGRRALVVSTPRDRGALAGLRALADAGWYVGAGSPDGLGLAAASRSCSARHVVPRPRGDCAAFLTGVQEAVRDGGYDVVLGGGDDWMAALSVLRDQIPAAVAHPSPDVVVRALDKCTLGVAAVAAGLSVPTTVVATPAAVARWQGPVVVKCRAHWSPGQTRPHRIDARRFDDISQAGARIEEIRAAGAEPVLQVPVAGRLGALVGVMHAGRLDARVQQVSDHLWPTPSGASARAVTVPVDTDLAERCERLLVGLGWTGLVELQLLTTDDGTEHLIDLNGRFYGSLGLAERARPGIVDSWARRVLGERVEPLPDGRPGVRYAWSAGDLRRARAERRGGLVADVVGSLAWSARARHSVWRVTDPGPAWYLASSRIHPEPAPPVPRQGVARQHAPGQVASDRGVPRQRSAAGRPDLTRRAKA